jgi:ketosteroid isomerase-like protein
MTADTGTTAREQIRALLNDRAAAITAKDADRAVAGYAPEVVSFSLAPPLRCAGDEVRDRAGIEGWFRTWDGPVGYDIGEPVGLRRTTAGWQITHEHDSTPFYMDGSGRAATDLRP